MEAKFDKGYVLVSGPTDNEEHAVLNHVFLGLGRVVVLPIVSREDTLLDYESYERMIGLERDDKFIEPVVFPRGDLVSDTLFFNELLSLVLGAGEIEFIVACRDPRVLIPVLLVMLLKRDLNLRVAGDGGSGGTRYRWSAVLRVPYLREYGTPPRAVRIPGVVGRIVDFVLKELGCRDGDCRAVRRPKGTLLLTNRYGPTSLMNLIYDLGPVVRDRYIEALLKPREPPEGAEVLDPDSTEPVSGPVSSGGDPLSAALALAFGLLGKGAVIGGIPVGSLRLNLGPISEYAPILRVFRGDPERDFDVQEVGRLANVGKKAYDYLRDLSKFGFLDVGLKRGPSSGRPRNLYRLTDFGRVLSRLL